MAEKEEPADDIVLPESDEELIHFMEKLLEVARAAGLPEEDLEQLRRSREDFVKACEESDRAERAAEAAEQAMLESSKRLMEMSAALRLQGVHIPGDPILPH